MKPAARGPLRRALRATTLAACAIPVEAQVVSPGYEALLRQYARGDRAAAVAALGTMRPGALDSEIRSLQRSAKDIVRCPSCPDPLAALPLRAAVMLHADRDDAERPPATGPEQPRQCTTDQARRAGQIAALLANRREGEREFARRFFLAMAQASQWDCCLESAEAWARDGLERFPRDPALLTTLGATLEERATLQRPQALSERSRRYRDAREFLSDALAADPTRDEARLRLGRVQYRLGDDVAARTTLEDALRRRPEPQHAYLAWLFLGQVHERGGRSVEAAQAFERALQVEPQSQAAAVGLSHAALLAGDSARTRAVLTRSLSFAGRRQIRDSYWDYVASDAASAPALFEILREEAHE